LTLITTHSLSAGAFLELAGGTGDSVVVRQLREAQLSKHLMLLHVVAEAAAGVDPPSPAAVAFRAGYQVLAQAQAADPGPVARLLGLPHVGSWTHDCLACLDRGTPPDFGYLAAVAAAAAIRAGIPFELNVSVKDGRVPLPGLGCLQVAGQGEWARFRGDGEWLRVGEDVDVAYAALVPDDGSGATVPHWRGTPLVKAVAGGQTWEVLLETVERSLDRYTLPMVTDLADAELASWRQRVQAGWELLVRHHEWASGPIAEGVCVIVPLVSRSDLDSATSPAAFGAIATSMPPTPVSMAETLIHEFQHIKLCGLMDMLPLIEPGNEKGYAPWREDPRPYGGILQGLYAFAGIVRFWDVQRRVEAEPDGILRASVLFERWRLAVGRVAAMLLDKGVLTPVGVRLLTELAVRAQRTESAPVPAEAAEIAREIALDNWLTWHLRHAAVDAARVAALAAAYRRGEPLGARELPDVWIEEDIRKVESVARSRLLTMRYLEPQRYRQLSAADLRELGTADALLVCGNAREAVAAYRAGLAAEPDPSAWIGLALAVSRHPVMSPRQVLVSRMPLLFEVHACLARQGVHADPLDLGAWFE
jgi:HEXXH motif-containing protein